MAVVATTAATARHAGVCVCPRVWTVTSLEDATRDRPCRVAVVEEELDVLLVAVPVDGIDPLGVERRRAPDDAVDLVALVEELLGEERPVLTGDAGDQRFLGHRREVRAAGRSW